MFAVMVSRINCQVSFLTMTIWSFMSLLLVVVIEVLAELNAEESGMEIKEYVSLKEELVFKTCIIN